ncbi:MAG: MFS transporter [Burkholderiaceae bacterium]
MSNAVLAPPSGAATPSAAAAPARFGARAGLRYGALGLPLAFFALPLYVLLPSYYAANYGMSLATLGIILLATRALDALLDPLIGGAVDRVFAHSTRAAWTVAATAAGVVAIGFVGLFFPPVANGELPAWLAVSLVVTYIAFSVLTVIHQAWGARLGGDALQRSRIVAWREGFGLVGVLVASVVPSLFGMGVASAVLAVALALGIALLARAPRAPSEPEAPGTSRGHWALPWRNPRFRGLLAVFMLNGIATAVTATLVLFFVRDRIQAPAWEPTFMLAYFAAAIASVPVWVRVVRCTGLTPAWLVGVVLAVLVFGAAFTLGAGDALGFLAVCIGSGVALGADLTVPGALLTGAIQRPGRRAGAEGIYLGWWNSATKLNLGLAAGAALPLLALAGYAPGQRDPPALQALGIAYVVVPCALKAVAGALLWRWRTTIEGDQ